MDEMTYEQLMRLADNAGTIVILLFALWQMTRALSRRTQAYIDDLRRIAGLGEPPPRERAARDEKDKEGA